MAYNQPQPRATPSALVGYNYAIITSQPVNNYNLAKLSGSSLPGFRGSIGAGLAEVTSTEVSGWSSGQ